MTGIIFGSSTGNTENAARIIAEKIEGSVLKSVTDIDSEFLERCSSLVLGTSTWGSGELQDDWEKGAEILKQSDLSGKKVALFGLGDQAEWADTFVDAMGILYDIVKDKGAAVVGSWGTEGYSFAQSAAVEGGKFVGLVLDDNNQSELTEERIEKWVQSIKGQLP